MVGERTDSAARLQALYAGNAFITPLDAEHAWFRYHHLFRELLRGQLVRTQPQQIPVLHGRAAAWYEAHGQPHAAIEHALAAEDYAHAVRLLEVHARPLVLGGYAQTVALWLHRLPPTWRAAGPHSNVAFAWSLLLRGQLEEIDGYLHSAETAMGATADLPASEQQGLAAEILALRAALVSLRGEPDRACDMARAAVAGAPADEIYVQGATRFCLATALNYAGRTVEAIAAYQEALPLCRTSGNSVAAMLSVANLAMLTIERGELHAAAALCRRVIAEAEAARALPSPMLASVYGALAHALYEWNELDEARHLAQKALELAERSGHIAAIAYGRVVLSRIEASRGNLAGAEQLAEQAAQLRGRAMPAWVAPYIVAQQAELALAQGDTAAAAAVLAASGVAADMPTGHTREVIHLAHLRLLLYQLHTRAAQQASGQRASDLHAGGQHANSRQVDNQEALALADRILASAEAGGRLGRVIEALAARALICALLPGKQVQARGDLQRALALGAASGYVRLFAGLGPDMAQLIGEFDPPPGMALYVADLRTILAGGEAKQEPQVQALAEPLIEPLIEPLSDRELKVLRLLAQGLTYQQTAAQLIVSVNTVRFHVKSIYGKLGVDNRTAALETARRLSVL
jgi:LuxR family maltose regulon positive regulatory protein